jgi:EAL domain-containing protein (putative c-di-GMP-specific phosphodiesterase class I)
MSRHTIPVMLGLTTLLIGAMLVAAFVMGLVSPGAALVAGAVLVLSVCMLAAAVVIMSKLTRVEDWLYSHDETLRDLVGRSDRAVARLTDVERQLSQPTPGIDRLVSDLGALRQEVKEAMVRKSEAPPADRDDAGLRNAPPESEHLELMLEPVIELSSGNTSHYRALINLANGRGEAVPHEDLMAKADIGGMRAALDAHVVRLVAPVLRRLRLKNPGLRIFVPLGRSTLGSRGEADGIIALLLQDSDIANGMVFELGQEDVGQLDSAGIENLARLGRLGATLALCGVYLGGLDLAALRQLGVRFLNFPPHAVDSGNGPSEVWREFVQYARAMQIQLIVGGIESPQQASAASKCARFGHGPFFAPPRKVRRDAGVAATPGRRANVA